MVECFLAKEDVAGSTPVSRSKNLHLCRSPLVKTETVPRVSRRFGAWRRNVWWLSLVFEGRARYPSGKGEVCKTFMRRFDPGPRLQSPPSTRNPWLGIAWKKVAGYGLSQTGLPSQVFARTFMSPWTRRGRARSCHFDSGAHVADDASVNHALEVAARSGCAKSIHRMAKEKGRSRRVGRPRLWRTGSSQRNALSQQRYQQRRVTDLAARQTQTELRSGNLRNSPARSRLISSAYW